MENCRVVQETTPGMQAFLDDDEEDDENAAMPLPDNAEEVLASIQGLMAKCEVVQQAARDMQDDTFWAGKMRQQQQQQLSQDKEESSDDEAS